MSQFADTQAIQTAVPESSLGDANQAVVGANDGLAAEFEAYLADPSMQVQAVGASESVPLRNDEFVTNPLAHERSDSLGDQILRMLDQVKGQIDDNFSRLAGAVDQVNPNSIKDLTELQYEVMRFSFELNMSSKISGEATQHVDRFLNQQ